MTKITLPTDQEVQDAIEILIRACHGRAKNNGWWTDLKTGQEYKRPIPECLCLIHSEVSEALEGYRKNKMDDHLPNRKMFDVELSDVLIRLFDLAGGYDVPLGEVTTEKMFYNDHREDHKLENRLKENGKKI